MSKFLILILILLFAHISLGQKREDVVPREDLSPIIFRADYSDITFLGLFNNYFNRTKSQVFLADTGIIRTHINYEIGTNRFQTLDLNHSQKISDKSSYFIDFRRCTFDGEFDHSIYENGVFNSGFSSRVDTGLIVDLALFHSSLSKELNWGMSDDTLINNPQLNRALVPVLSESSEFSSRSYRLKGNVLYGKKVLKLGAGFDLQRRDYFYYDEIGSNTALYDTFYFDSTLTQDLMKEGYEQYYAQLSTRSRINILFKTGILRKYYENFGLTQRNMPFSSLELSKDSLVVFGFSTVYGDGVFVNSYLNTHFGLLNGWVLDFGVKMTHGSNSEFYNVYNSNHVRWDKTNAANTRFNINANFSDSLKRFGADLNIMAENNAMIWTDSIKEFTSTSDLQSILRMNLWMRHRIGDQWRFSLSYGFNNAFSGSYFKYPGHTLNASISKMGMLFKEKLKYRLSLEPEYYSRFDQYLFNPVLFSVYPGDQRNELPGYLYTNLKLTAWLGDVELFFKVWHINQGITPYNYFDFTDYWGKDRFVSFGLKKVFTN